MSGDASLNRYRTGVYLVILSGVCYGFLPILATYAYQGGATVSEFVFLRFGISSVVFLLYMAFFKSDSFKIGDRTRILSLVPLLLVVGIFHLVESYLYMASVQYIAAPLASLLFYTYPIWVAIWGFLFLKERLKLPGIAGIALAIIGLVMVTGTSLGRINSYGILLALGAALSCSFYIMASNRALKKMDPVITSTFICLFTAVMIYLWGSITGTLRFQMSSGAWLAIFAAALLTSNVAIFALMAGMKRIGSTTTSILSTLEPVTAVVFSALLLSQKLTAIQLLGGLVILLGAMLVVTAKRPAAAKNEHYTSKNPSGYSE